MQRFDCLALNCPIFGPHILEASAGTGKTFSIEHVFVRLILESRDPPIEVEQILTVTFTRAATRELKTRIRSNLEKALFFLRTEDRESAPPYLHPFFGSIEAVRALSDAISAFDRCQIYTIHAFCYRMLKEFAFEAKVGFSLPNPEERRIPEKLKRAVTDFLELGLKEEWICPEQCSILIKKYSSFEELSEQLLKLEKGQGIPFSQLLEQYKLALQGWKDPIEEGKLLQDFLALQGSYKAKKGNFERQIASLAKSFQDPLFLRELIKDQGTLFDFLAPTNRKVKAVSPPFLHYPGFFDWAREHLAAFIEQSPKQVMQLIQSMWNPIAEKILLEEEHLNPDEILLQMRKAVELPLFAKQVQQKYTVAIIDEFQDTDPVQWDIFRSLFLEGAALRAFYLVGDPKQSIYRFRNADVYTYIQARDFLGEENLYHLDTNFRSSKKLIGALNALFARDWLTLPKVNRTLPY
ncbi:MAG TPA: UvrD-helicase domain-containing protein, partial [Chlamydiales bacterium]|nr:UvrD-helicase domain-containing protein [Chlamydiales bacterium]